MYKCIICDTNIGSREEPVSLPFKCNPDRSRWESGPQGHVECIVEILAAAQPELFKDLTKFFRSNL